MTAMPRWSSISDDELRVPLIAGVYLGAGARALVDQSSLIIIISQNFGEEVDDVRDGKYNDGFTLG